MESLNALFMNGLHDISQVYNKVMNDYKQTGIDICSDYFDIEINNISKIDLLQTYSELQFNFYVFVIDSTISNDNTISPKILGSCDNKDFLQQMVDKGILKGLEGSFTGNMRDFLTEIEQLNPCLCRFIDYDVNLDNIISFATSIEFFKKNSFIETYGAFDKYNDYEIIS